MSKPTSALSLVVPAVLSNISSPDVDVVDESKKLPEGSVPSKRQRQGWGEALGYVPMDGFADGTGDARRLTAISGVSNAREAMDDGGPLPAGCNGRGRGESKECFEDRIDFIG
jgi:hypothetical protein